MVDTVASKAIACKGVRVRVPPRAPVGYLKVVAGVIGVVIFIATSASVVGTVVVPRGSRSRLFKFVDRSLNGAFKAVTGLIEEFSKRDRILSLQAPVTFLTLLVFWLGCYISGLALFFWSTEAERWSAAFKMAGSAIFTLGFVVPKAPLSIFVAFVGSATGLIVIAAQIAYLPTLYAAFNRRETAVTLLDARTGRPAWGPELLIRTRYGTRRGISVDPLPALFSEWERWAADVSESHTNYTVLIRFRSPHRYSSWLISLLAVMDSAALYLSLSPDIAPNMEARMCLRMGFTCLQQIASVLGYDPDPDPDPDSGISISFEDFEKVVESIREVGFPVERTAKEAWPDFRGWRVNYEQPAFAIAYEIDAVPAMWSGPRRRGRDEPIRPTRPLNRVSKEASSG